MRLGEHGGDDVGFGVGPGFQKDGRGVPVDADAIGSVRRQGLRKRFFFEKKNQKTFIRWSPVGRRWHKLNGQKFFGSFFQKRTAFLSLVF
jgi:hypothetical protein